MSERAGRGPGPRGGRGAQIGDDGKAGGAGVKSKRSVWRGGRKPSGKSGVSVCSSADDDDAGFDGRR